MNLNVPEKWRPFIRAKMKGGHYRSEDDILDEALRLLKLRDSERTKEHVRIEALLIEGLDSGLSSPMTSSDWDEVEREGRRLIAARKTRKAR
jgi:antitoxin ParD1/3/4